MAWSKDLSTSNQYVKYQIGITQGTQSIAKNSTTVTVSVWFHRTNTGYETYGTGTVYCKINGKQYSSSVGLSQKITNSGIYLFTQTVDIAHNSDGTKSLTVSAWIDHSQVTSDEQSYTQTLTTIPRASTLDSMACSTSYFNGQVTIKYTPKATFTHKLKLTTNGGVAVATLDLGSQTAGQKTYSFTLSSTNLSTIYNQYPSATSGDLTAVVETYNGTTLVGSSDSKSITLTIPTSVKPSLTITVSEVETAIQTNFNAYVQSLSRLSISVTAICQYGASVVSYNGTANGETFTTSTYTTNYLISSGSLTISVTVTDTRGRSTTSTNTITVVPYQKPKIEKLTALRCNAGGTAVDDGTYARVEYKSVISSVNSKNSAQYYIDVKASNATTYTRSFRISTTGYSVEDYMLISGMDINTSYDVRFRAIDKMGTTETTTILSTAFTTVDYRDGGKGIAFGKVSEKEAFEVAFPAEFSGGVQVNALVNTNGVRLDGMVTKTTGSGDSVSLTVPTIASGRQTLLFYGDANGAPHVGVAYYGANGTARAISYSPLSALTLTATLSGNTLTISGLKHWDTITFIATVPIA